MVKNIINKKTKCRFVHYMLIFLIFAVIYITQGKEVNASPANNGVITEMSLAGFSASDHVNFSSASTGVPEVDESINRMNRLLIGAIKALAIGLGIVGAAFCFMNLASHQVEQRNMGIIMMGCAVLVYFSPEIISAILG